MTTTAQGLPDPFQAYTSFQFAVAIDGVNMGIFTQFTLPDIEVETIPIKEGGLNEYTHQLPVRVKVGTARLERGISRDMSLLAWYQDVLLGNADKMMRQVTVTLHDTQFKPMLIWSFLNAYPTKWSGPKLESGSSSIAIEALEFVHHGFRIESV
jgi:phage tail-like protein